MFSSTIPRSGGLFAGRDRIVPADSGTAAGFDRLHGRQTGPTEAEHADRPSVDATNRNHRTLSDARADERQDQGHDPEANDDLRLGPALLLEMMMDRRHQKDATSGQFEISDLDDDAQGLDDKHAADHREDDLMLNDGGGRADRRPEGKRAGIPHEHGGRRSVVPKKAEPGPDKCGRKYQQFAGSRHVMDVEIVGEIDPSHPHRQ